MSETVENSNDQLVSITPKALVQIEQILQGDPAHEGKGLRLMVIGGGCSGLSYNMDMSAEKPNDNILKFGNVTVYIDPKSSIYLKGITLDYQDGLQGKGFVFENPNAKNTCGCGESFSV